MRRCILLGRQFERWGCAPVEDAKRLGELVGHIGGTLKGSVEFFIARPKLCSRYCGTLQGRAKQTRGLATAKLDTE